LLSVLDSLEALLVSLLLLLSPLEPTMLAWEERLLSVEYQPRPLKMTLGASSTRLASAWHNGHGATFSASQPCRNSNLLLQLGHW